MNGEALCASMMAEGANPDRTPVQQSLSGWGHNAECGLMLDDEGDIDREFAVALDELAGAVEGIDHPELAPGLTLGPGGLSRLLGQDRYVGGQCGQSLENDSLRLQIGQGQGRV